ncbi:MAG: methyltransferase [Alphaproteobacteria bacterium]|nr:methyltransferase [Alphaproteobacteria bacterium]
MSSTDSRSASLLVDALAAGLDDAARWLIVDDPAEDVPLYLRTRGRVLARWHRHAGHGVTASAEPPAGDFEAVGLSLPKGREAMDYAVDLAASRLAPGGRIWLHGANDEGIKSAGKRLAPLFTEVEAVDAKRHCRLWRGVRSEVPALGSLAAHRATRTLPLPGGPVELVSYPGVFAKGGLDEGSRLLLEALMELERPAPRTALDFACGVGVLGRGAQQRWPELTLHACDADAVAIAAARENLPGAELVAASGLDAFEVLTPPRGGYDLVLSNPPIHVGKELDLGVLERLVARLPSLLAPGGAAILVVQRQRATHQLLEAALGRPRLLKEDGRFRVWMAQG